MAGLGLVIRHTAEGKFIDRIMPLTAAARSGRLQVHDRLVEVNYRRVDGMTPKELAGLLKTSGTKRVALLVQKARANAMLANK